MKEENAGNFHGKSSFSWENGEIERRKNHSTPLGHCCVMFQTHHTPQNMWSLHKHVTEKNLEYRHLMPGGME